LKLNQDLEPERPVKVQEEKPSKRGRKPKESDKITEEDHALLDDGVTTPNEVAEKRGIKRTTVDNARRRRREKLSIKMNMKPADSTLPQTEGDISQSNNFENPDEQGGTNVGGVPDATEALKGMYSFLDTMLVVTSTMTKGRLEYTKLSQEEIDRLAVTSNQSPHLRQFAQNDNLSGIVIAGTIIGTFGSHLKFNLEKRHDEKKALENKCECKKCLEAPRISKDEIDTILETEMKVNDIPKNVQKTPEEVIAQNTAKPTIDESVEFNESLPSIVPDTNISKDRYESTPEYVLPKTNDAGEIVE
jgi:hypothetical protein